MWKSQTQPPRKASSHEGSSQGPQPPPPPRSVALRLLELFDPRPSLLKVASPDPPRGNPDSCTPLRRNHFNPFRKRARKRPHLTGSGGYYIQVMLSCSKRIDLLTFRFSLFWSIFSRGPKRLTFYIQVLWATENDNVADYIASMLRQP